MAIITRIEYKHIKRWAREFRESYESAGKSKAIARGVVTRGEGKGRKMFFPTANIAVLAADCPADGLYFTVVERGGLRHAAYTIVSSPMKPPYVENGQLIRVAETHIFDFDEQIYNESVTLIFVARIPD